MVPSTHLVGVDSGVGVGVDPGGSESESGDSRKLIDSAALNPDHKDHIMPYL